MTETGAARNRIARIMSLLGGFVAYARLVTGDEKLARSATAAAVRYRSREHEPDDIETIMSILGTISSIGGKMRLAGSGARSLDSERVMLSERFALEGLQIELILRANDHSVLTAEVGSLSYPRTLH